MYKKRRKSSSTPEMQRQPDGAGGSKDPSGKVRRVRKRRAPTSENYTAISDENFLLNRKEVMPKNREELKREYDRDLKFGQPSTSKQSNKKSSDSRKGFVTLDKHQSLKVLLVFGTVDRVAETLQEASEKLGFETVLCLQEEIVLEEFQRKHHDLILIDTRSKTFDYDTICRSIRNTKGSQQCVMISIIKRSMLENDDYGVRSLLLDSGFTRCISETTSVVAWMNELQQLKLNDCKNATQLATAQSFYKALDHTRDVVIITEDNGRIQHINNTGQRFLGYRSEEYVGRKVNELLLPDAVQSNAFANSFLRGRVWSNPLSVRRKGVDGSVTLPCRTVPMSLSGKNTTNYVIILEPDVDETVASTMSRGSIQSFTRKTSLDMRSMGSDYYRRTSMAKLSSLPLEAPITKIIALVSQAQELAGGNVNLIATLDRVVDTLRCTELYSPQFKEDISARHDEPVASDLIGALLNNHPMTQFNVSSRRSSNDSSFTRSSKANFKIKATNSIIRETLDKSLHWDFDIFQLEAISNGRPLAHLGLNLFGIFDVANVLQVDEKTLYNWLTVIEANYHSNNPYHNSTHAADVMQAIAGFLDKERLKSIMDPLDEATALIAACAHDVDHPGKSSAFLSNCDDGLAILYNDITVLESHHAAFTFKLTLANDKSNIFKNLDRETYKIARQNVVDMILATEMTKHFEHLTKFVNVFCTKSINQDSEGDDQYFPLSGIDKRENLILIKRIMIKCADVSNPTRPLALCVEWARRIAEEYFDQTDEEMKRDLPVMMPMFDRRTCSIPKSQIGFIDFIIEDMIKAWNDFIDMPEMIKHMRENYLKWKEYDEQGHATVTDIVKLQATALNFNPIKKIAAKQN